jgi:hypothetical protein
VASRGDRGEVEGFPNAEFTEDTEKKDRERKRDRNAETQWAQKSEKRIPRFARNDKFYLIALGGVLVSWLGWKFGREEG